MRRHTAGRGHVYRDMAPTIRCRTVVRHRQRHAINTVSEPPPSPPPPPPPPHTPPPPKAQIGLVIFCSELFFTLPSVIDMPLHGEFAVGAAMRRRQRRLRSWLRHERMTVAMTLAELTHHTAPRGLKMARVGEGVENATCDGLRAQKFPLSGERPVILAEPGCLLTLGLLVLAGRWESRWTPPRSGASLLLPCGIGRRRSGRRSWRSLRRRSRGRTR